MERVQGFGSATGTLDKVSISIIGIGINVLRLRLPLLKSEEFPHGQLQPYATGGPAVFRTKMKDTDTHLQRQRPTTAQETLKSDFNTHHLIGGVSFRFN